MRLEGEVCRLEEELQDAREEASKLRDQVADARLMHERVEAAISEAGMSQTF